MKLLACVTALDDIGYTCDTIMWDDIGYTALLGTSGHRTRQPALGGPA